MVAGILSRVTTRLGNEENSPEIVADIVQTIIDRICLRVGVANDAEFPALLYSVAVDASVKAYRRYYFEGIQKESAGGIDTTFVNDILDEYAEELGAWIDANAKDSAAAKVVRFL